MSFTANFTGHIKAATPDAAKDLEQELFDRISGILSEPEYGVTNSGFTGQYVGGNSLHIKQDDPAVEHVHENTGDSEE